MTSNLLKATLELLDATSREEWNDIAAAVGVTYTWLRQLDDGKIKEPGVNKIERLYAHLSGKALQI